MAEDDDEVDLFTARLSEVDNTALSVKEKLTAATAAAASEFVTRLADASAGGVRSSRERAA
jgi:uncharacterized protein YciW